MRFIALLIVALCLDFFPGVRAQQAYADHSVLSQGSWTRWAVATTGIQFISATALQNAGWTLPLESSKIRVFGNGGKMLPENTSDPRTDDLKEVACLIRDQGDGLIDAPEDGILFYAEGPVTWTWDSSYNDFRHQLNFYNYTSVYFINVSLTPGKRVNIDTTVTDSPVRNVSLYQDHYYHESDTVNLLKTGKTWFGEKFASGDEISFPLAFPQISLNDSVTVRMTCVARSGDSTYFKMNLWGQTADIAVKNIDGSMYGDYVKPGMGIMKVLPQSDQAMLKISYEATDANATGWLNDFEVTAWRSLNFSGGQMLFRNSLSRLPGVIQYDLGGLTPEVLLWNVTDPWNVTGVPLDTGTPAVSFKRNGGAFEEFAMFDGTSFYSPVFIEKVEPQDLHDCSFPDMVIVTHPLFKDQADRLAAFHTERDSMEVQVIELQKIYNEFSSGMQDPSAIRDFMRMLWFRAGSDATLRPRYLLLFGDGSYDLKGRIFPDDNFIPTYQTMNSVLPTASYVSDDYFGLLDDNEGVNAFGLLNIGVGRLPVGTNDEARDMVDKILRYGSPVDLLPPASDPATTQVSNFAQWRGMLTFIADDEDGNLHFNQAETLVALVDSLTESFNFSKIYLDAFQQYQTLQGERYPGAHEALLKKFAKGSLIINYTGHGGETGLAEERLLEMSDIAAMQNYYNLPVLVTATCEFSRYDNPAERSAGEHLLLLPAGGVIAMLSTTRVAYAHSNMIMNTNLLISTFAAGSSHRLGDMIRLGKVLSGTGVYMQNFTLLGDPALKLSIPEHKIVIDSLNGESLDPGHDTVYAGSRISVAGFIAGDADELLADFNGEVSCVVYDKPELVSTLANDYTSNVETFSTRSSVLYQGVATVSGGRFNMEFTLPADVSFREGNARFSFYARALNEDAFGSSEDFVLVNEGGSFHGNGQGPLIQLFMNDRGFEENGIVSSTADFIADLEDEDGINFFNAGMGHDILMVLDDDFVNPQVLNDYYIPATNHSGKGTLKYPLSGLSEGPHKIWLRSWDVLNYSSEKELNFIVRENFDLSMDHVRVIPNPMITETGFCFERNQTNGKEWVKLIIRTLDGKNLYEKETTLPAGSGISQCIPWDGSAYNGQIVPAGLYMYTLVITDESGEMKQSSGLLSKCE